ncbi:MAG: hypothetical protein KIT33_12200 [Candidatus Kapabacteria bacterium]|nr:hypothetical protein [Ignavibacteriota bacterium]MCW5885722.1 hypothetical protein [Candidatus Kapabacteria bacterium]
MKLKLSFGIAILLFLSPLIILSQGGSNFSILGVGDINYGGNASYTGLAGTQIAFPAENSINLRNPAMWSFVTNTRLQAGYKFNQNVASTEESTIWHNNGTISGFSAIFAVDSATSTAASLGIVPYSNINYLTATRTQIQEMGLDMNGTTTYQGKGGISLAYFGASTKITDWFGIGGSVHASFGVVESLRETEFDNDFYSFKYTTRRSDFVNGWGAKAGAFFEPVKSLILGISYEAQPGLSLQRETQFRSPTIPDTTMTSDMDFSIPPLFGVGASYSSGNFIVGADFSMQNFANFDFNPGSQTEFTNAYMASLGVNRIGNPSLNADFSDRVSYKFGVGYNQLYYRVLDNQVAEYIASIGMQFPFQGTLLLDFSFTLGYRTANDTRLVNEYFGRFGFDLSIGETWFVPFRREY